MMTFAEWVKKYNGKQIEWDDVSYYQCVDEVKCYLQEVFGIKTKGRGVSVWGDAKEYYLKFNDKSWAGYSKLHNAGFRRIAKTPEFVPMKGDVCVWNNGTYGHVAVATGEGTTSYFYSYDQNWGGKYMHKVKHSYSFFLGVLRPPHKIKADVNVRSGPGLTYKRVDELKKGEKVIIYSIDGKWAKIGYNRFISANFVDTL